MMDTSSSSIASRPISYSISNDWASVLDKKEELNIVLRNTVDSVDNRYHKGFVTYEKPLQNFCTNSSYEGNWNVIDFSGFGKYTFPHDVTYEGYFDNGLFHGNGTITYNDGDDTRTILARYDHGELLENTISFKVGNVEVNPNEFYYCKMPDRRFAVETTFENLMPVGKEYLSNSETTRQLPEKSFDVGNGIFEMKRNIVVEDPNPNNPGRRIRIPNASSELWIKQNCRFADDVPTGYHPKDYECWTGGRKFEMGICDFARQQRHIGFTDTNTFSSISNPTDSDTDIPLSSKVASLYEKGVVSKIMDTIQDMIDGKESKGEICGKDSVSDTEANKSIFSIIDYLERQYSQWAQPQEEYQPPSSPSNIARDTALSDDLAEYLKRISVEIDEQSWHYENVSDGSDILTDVDYSLEDMAISEEEVMYEEKYEEAIEDEEIYDKFVGEEMLVMETSKEQFKQEEEEGEE